VTPRHLNAIIAVMEREIGTTQTQGHPSTSSRSTGPIPLSAGHISIPHDRPVNLRVCRVDRIAQRRYSDSLRVGRFGYRIPMRVRFSALVQSGPGAHPVSCTMGTGSFPWVKRRGRGIGHPPQLAPRLKKE
jgi:hypothetical protein